MAKDLRRFRPTQPSQKPESMEQQLAELWKEMADLKADHQVLKSQLLEQVGTMKSGLPKQSSPG